MIKGMLEKSKAGLARLAAGVAGALVVALPFAASADATVDYTTPNGLFAVVKTALVDAFAEIIPFVIWALMLLLSYGLCLWAYNAIAAKFGVGGVKGGGGRRGRRK